MDSDVTNEQGDPGHFVVVYVFRLVGYLMIVGVITGVEADDRDVVLHITAMVTVALWIRMFDLKAMVTFLIHPINEIP